MSTATPKEIDGSLMFAVPPDFSTQLDWQPGASVEVELKGKGLVVSASAELASRRRPRRNPYKYTLAELLANSDYSYPKTPEEIEEEKLWLNFPPVGRELI